MKYVYFWMSSVVLMLYVHASDVSNTLYSRQREPISNVQMCIECLNKTIRFDLKQDRQRRAWNKQVYRDSCSIDLLCAHTRKTTAYWCIEWARFGYKILKETPVSFPLAIPLLWTGERNLGACYWIPMLQTYKKRIKIFYGVDCQDLSINDLFYEELYMRQRLIMVLQHMQKDPESMHIVMNLRNDIQKMPLSFPEKKALNAFIAAELSLRAVEAFQESYQIKQNKPFSLTNNLCFKVVRYLKTNQPAQNLGNDAQSISSFRYRLWLDHGLD